MTKRVYEAAKEYGVPAKTVIKTLEDHHIKAGNFTGIDANMKSILDASFKKGAKGTATGHKAENKQTGEGTSRKVKETSRQNKNKKNGNQPKQNNQNQNHNHNAKHQNQGGLQKPAKAAQANQNQGGQKSSNTNQNSQNRQGGDNKRTKYFGHSQGGSDNRGGSNNKNKRGGQNNRNNNKNGGSRPHTLLSNVLNKGKHHNKNKRNQKHQAPVQEAPKKKNYPTSIELPETIIVKDFAERLGRDVGEVMKKLLMGGIMATINQELDFETASLIADEFGVTVTKEAPPEDPTEIEEIIDPPETLKTRPPVVTIMGHVDHGKTSLLDAIRQTNVTSHEAGGITQHIGAYQVRYQGKKITFMDTPGHEAFTAMRARGAQVTDIAVLVVAADDGVMPQTVESINHAKSAGVPIIVAINKIDKESANPEHVMQQLTEYGLVSEDWGGDTIMVPVSAHKKIGLDDLLENILVLAEVQDLKANPNRPAQGVVIEAKLDKGRGPVASVLIQKGTLRVGDTIIVGTCFGKVRAMNNERGERVKKAEPSIPVEILGLNDVPEAGDILNVTDEKTARSVAEKRLEKKRSSELHVNAKVTLDDLFNQIQQGELKELPLIIKGDVQGSVEALSQSLMGIKSDEVRISIVHAGVGAINESDVMLASASNALIIGFNVRPDAAARKMAEHEKVDMRMYRVIYDAINDVEAAIKGMLEKKYEEKIIGRAEVRKVITTPKVIVGGSYVKEGKITSTAKVRLIRNGIVVHEGEIDGLRRFKDDVKEVPAGYECGITLDKYRDIKEGDEIEAYEMVEVEPE
ncbi:MAG: translation initiation factor IF-2 [Megasphaera sp.]|uniref:translation initiation factor IF-2 n=1 Tax=Megasphaera sp. TaxID=2023260 RepID=UPI0025EDCF95|nr:translation initiation factor IF-2 [uncultured Megasphaera sp.]